MKTGNRPVLVVLAATALVLGCGPREESAEQRVTGQNRTAAPTVGTVKAPDGVELRYEVAGRGEPTLVFVHGWSCDRSYWRAQMDHFAAKHRVVAVDLGGHGESGLGRKDWTMAAFVGDVRAVVDALGLQKVVLVGHSMGGPVIVEAARLLPNRVAALVSVDFFNDVDKRYSVQEREGFLAPMRADFSKMTHAFVRQEMFTAHADSSLAERISRDMASGPSAVAISAMENLLRYHQGAAMASAKVPVRLINADKWPTDLEAIRRHNAAVGLAVMPAVGHFLMMEDPEEFNRLLTRAISELLAR